MEASNRLTFMNYYKNFYFSKHFSLDTDIKMYFDSEKWIKVVLSGGKCLEAAHFIRLIQKGE